MRRSGSELELTVLNFGGIFPTSCILRYRTRVSQYNYRVKQNSRGIEEPRGVWQKALGCWKHCVIGTVPSFAFR